MAGDTTDARERRLGAALRENLRRRKLQAKARDAAAIKKTDPEGTSGPDSAQTPEKSDAG